MISSVETQTQTGCIFPSELHMITIMGVNGNDEMEAECDAAADLLSFC